jgi:hypothetical protein
MSSELAQKIVDQIADNKLSDARDSIQQGMQKAAADAVDMKRIQMQFDWMNGKKED